MRFLPFLRNFTSLGVMAVKLPILSISDQGDLPGKGAWKDSFWEIHTKPCLSVRLSVLLWPMYKLLSQCEEYGNGVYIFSLIKKEKQRKKNTAATKCVCVCVSPPLFTCLRCPPSQGTHVWGRQCCSRIPWGGEGQRSGGDRRHQLQ